MGQSEGAAVRTAGSAATSRASTSGKRTTVPSLREGLVVGLDRFRVVEVIDHDAVGLLDAARCEIAQPVHPFERGAIAEMEARDRVGGTVPTARAGQISRTCRSFVGPTAIRFSALWPERFTPRPRETVG